MVVVLTVDANVTLLTKNPPIAIRKRREDVKIFVNMRVDYGLLGEEKILS